MVFSKIFKIEDCHCIAVPMKLKNNSNNNNEKYKNVIKTYIMYLIIVSNSISKVYHYLVTKCFPECIRTYPMSAHPPGHRYYPQDDECNEDHIIEEVATELTNLTSN